MARPKKSAHQGAPTTTPTDSPKTSVQPSAKDALTPPDSSELSVITHKPADFVQNNAQVSPDKPMFDPAALGEAPQLARRGETDFSTLGVDELLAIRHEIDQRLPALTLAEVDLEGELLLQYHSAKALLARVMDNPGVPANQKAQVLNTCTSVLEQITRTQTALYNAERIKAMEMALEKTFAGTAQALRQDFFDRYSESLRELASTKKDKK